MSVLLECCDIEKHYKLINTTGEESTAWLQALNKVSFTLNEGDRLGLVGLNGSGKSTLLKILSGITKPTAGYVKLYKKIHNLSGFDSMLHTDMTGRQNIKFQLALMDYDTRQTNNAIEEIADFSGLSRFIDQPVKNYSSGMMLRLSFSILKTIKPEILLLDEVLAVGDMVFRDKVTSLIKEHFNSVAGIIMASHQLTEISEYCNKCLVLNKGEIEYMGNVSDALAYYDGTNTLFSEEKVQNEDVVLEKVWTNADNDTYSVSQPIDIYLSYTKKTEAEIIPVLYISGIYGNILTDSPRFRQNFTAVAQQTGTYTYKISVPANFFNVGTYHVTVVLGSINKVLIQAKNSLQFTIVQDEWEKGKNWEIPTFFPVRVKLDWKELFDPNSN